VGLGGSAWEVGEDRNWEGGYVRGTVHNSLTLGWAPSSTHCDLCQPLPGGVHTILAFDCAHSHLAGF
jgi:hypothetical protein